MQSKCLPVLLRAYATLYQEGNICSIAANISESSVHFPNICLYVLIKPFDFSLYMLPQRKAFNNFRL